MLAARGLDKMSDWRPNRVNGPDDDDNNNNHSSRKAKLVFLPIPDELKQKGVRGVIYGRTFISLDYNGNTFTFTVHKEDITKTRAIYDKELNHEVDEPTKGEIWSKCISNNWLKHIYTEEEIERDVIRGIGKCDAILQIAKENIQRLSKDERNKAYAVIKVNEHLETVSPTSKRFKNWLRKIIKKEHDTVVSSNAIEDVVGMLCADAEIDGEVRPLAIRFASAPNDTLGLKLKWYYDLTNPEWEFIEITSEGWKVIKSNDSNSDKIFFRRYGHEVEQDYPEPNYHDDIFEQFMNLLNVRQKDRLLLKCYIIALFIPDLPKAVLMVHGEQGTAKSMLQELIVMLVDPTITKTLTFPRSTEEFVRELSHHAIAYYDNISIIRQWISDLICKAVTGSGFSKRELYTDDEDVNYILLKAIGFNGINLAATKADLLSRGLIIQTDTIPKDDVLKVKTIWNKFNTMRPQLLGYILDLLVKVLKWKKENPSTELIKQYPRMADWAEHCEIIAHCMGEKDGAFMEAYNQNIDLQTQEVIEANDVAIALIILIDILHRDGREFDGSATSLLEKLHSIAATNSIDTKNRYWPKTPSRLSNILHTLQKTLRDYGIEIQWSRDGTKNNAKIIRIFRKVASEPSEPSENQKQARILDKYSDGSSSTDKVSSENQGENHAQNIVSDASDASDGVLTKSDNALSKLRETKPTLQEKIRCSKCGEWIEPFYIRIHRCE